MDDVFISMQDVSRTYRQGQTSVTAVVDATCTVKQRDHIAVVGPSGSGKSTLLHLLGGLDLPSTGQVSWPALGLRSGLRPMKIGFIFQTQSLLAPLNAVENVELPLLLAGVDAGTARSAAVIALESLRLGTLAEKLPEELSGGQMQRIAVARTLACHPQVILADEPTGQLDHPTAKQLFDTLLDLLQDSDAALVVATHDLSLAERMNQRWLMRHGTLEVSDLA